MAISPKLLTDGESVVIDTRTHPKALILPVLVLLVTVAVAIFLDKHIGNGVVSLIVWILALLVVVWFTLRPFLDWLTSTYTITTKRLITREGVLARRGHDIPHVESVQRRLTELLDGSTRAADPRTDDGA